MDSGGAPMTSVHLKPVSILHVDEQPSPSRVFPSSQASPVLTTPLPQRRSQAEAPVIQSITFGQKRRTPALPVHSVSK